MTATSQSSISVNAPTDDRVFRKVFRRLIWFLFILLVVSFMDRINIAFAALTMNKDLGLSAVAYGMSFTVFYAAYTLFEIPSNLMLAKVGARLWIARIMITWGLASAATMFVTWHTAPAARSAPTTAAPRAPVPPVTTTLAS